LGGDWYFQREIGKLYQLHPTTVGVILRKNKEEELLILFLLQTWGRRRINAIR